MNGAHMPVQIVKKELPFEQRQGVLTACFGSPQWYPSAALLLKAKTTKAQQ